MRGQKTGGRQKGSVNKATQEIRAILEEVVDWKVVVGKLYELVQGVEVAENSKEGPVYYSKPPDSSAGKILLEYGFGKPKQDIELKGEVDTHVTFTETIISKKV